MGPPKRPDPRCLSSHPEALDEKHESLGGIQLTQPFSLLSPGSKPENQPSGSKPQPSASFQRKHRTSRSREALSPRNPWPTDSRSIRCFGFMAPAGLEGFITKLSQTKEG